MADALGNVVGLVPVALGAGIVLGTLGLIERMNASQAPPSMKDYKVKSIQDMF
jgi:hypothetical protein